jgi:hypothetical protein
VITFKHIHVVDHRSDDDLHVELFTELKLINQKITQLMAEFKDIKAAWDGFKNTIVEERTQIHAKLAELQSSIDNLTTNIQQGGTTEERDALLTDINDQVSVVKEIIPDPATPLPDVPTEGEPQV